jgi:hypothetical protein
MLEDNPKIDPDVGPDTQELEVDPVRFLTALWGADADGKLAVTHFVCDHHERRFNHHQVVEVSAAVEQALRLSSGSADVYFACAEFQVGKSRKGENAIGAYSFWIDLDCGLAKAAEKKGYIDKEAALAALVDFCTSMGLPEPSIIVCSGYGLHCYWHFGQLIVADQWRAVANRLKVTTKRHGLLADPTRTADIASVLRVPGTQNWKDRDNPQQVAILHFGPSIDFATFYSALDAVE